MDSRDVIAQVAVRIEEVVVGDFVRAPGWTRPRFVAALDADAGGPILSLEEADESRKDENGIRRVTAEDWNRRGVVWFRYPNLSKLFARHPASEEE